MNVTILLVEGCPHAALARERIAEAAAAVAQGVVVTETVVHDEASAAAAGFRGSPTILVEGVDPFPAAGGSELACRLYPGSPRPEGAPPVAELVGALRRAEAGEPIATSPGSG